MIYHEFDKRYLRQLGALEALGSPLVLADKSVKTFHLVHDGVERLKVVLHLQLSLGVLVLSDAKIRVHKVVLC